MRRKSIGRRRLTSEVESPLTSQPVTSTPLISTPQELHFRPRPTPPSLSSSSDESEDYAVIVKKPIKRRRTDEFNHQAASPLPGTSRQFDPVPQVPIRSSRQAVVRRTHPRASNFLSVRRSPIWDP
ncbi:hypothetical protein X975_27157, partial [Stegodyphus mimosarum]